MAFKKQQSSDRDLQFVQDNVSDALAPLQAMPMVGGNVIATQPSGTPRIQPGAVVINTTSTAIPHGLDHVPRYWVALGVDRAAIISNAAPFDSKFIYLQADNACFAIIWVN